MVLVHILLSINNTITLTGWIKGGKGCDKGKEDCALLGGDKFGPPGIGTLTSLHNDNIWANVKWDGNGNILPYRCVSIVILSNICDV